MTVEAADVALEALGEWFHELEGRVVPYNQPTNVGGFYEQFAPGAFVESIAVSRGALPLLLWHDNKMIPIGVGVEWSEERDGLYGRFKLASEPVAQVSAQAARDSFLTGMSVGFVPQLTTWQYAPDWDPDRGVLDTATRTKARLLEVSLTPTPAYVGALVTNVRAEAVAPAARSRVREARAWMDARRRIRSVDADAKAAATRGSDLAAWKRYRNEIRRGTA